MGRKRDGSGGERGGSCFITDVLAYCSRKIVLKCNLFLLTEISGMGWREGEMCGGGRGGSCYKLMLLRTALVKIAVFVLQVRL